MVYLVIETHKHTHILQYFCDAGRVPPLKNGGPYSPHVNTGRLADLILLFVCLVITIKKEESHACKPKCTQTCERVCMSWTRPDTRMDSIG